jgi:hypothetical protein
MLMSLIAARSIRRCRLRIASSTMTRPALPTAVSAASIAGASDVWLSPWRTVEPDSGALAIIIQLLPTSTT